MRAGLHFDGVLKVQSHKVKLGADEAVVSLLAVRFTPNDGEDPGGVIELVLAGGGAFRLTVECIDAELADMTAAWAARGKPDHDGESLMARRLKASDARSPRISTTCSSPSAKRKKMSLRLCAASSPMCARAAMRRWSS